MLIKPPVFPNSNICCKWRHQQNDCSLLHSWNTIKLNVENKSNPALNERFKAEWQKHEHFSVDNSCFSWCSCGLNSASLGMMWINPSVIFQLFVRPLIWHHQMKMELHIGLEPLRSSTPPINMSLNIRPTTCKNNVPYHYSSVQSYQIKLAP